MCKRLTRRVLPRLHHTHLALGCRLVNHSSRRVLATVGRSTSILDIRRLLCTTALIRDTGRGAGVCGGAMGLCPGSCHTCGGLTRLTVGMNSCTTTGGCLGGTVGLGTSTTRIGAGLNVLTLVSKGMTSTRNCLMGNASTGTGRTTLNGLCVTRNRCRHTMDTFNSAGDGTTTLTRVVSRGCATTGGALGGIRAPSTCACCLGTVMNTHAGGTTVMTRGLMGTIHLSSDLHGGTIGSIRFGGFTSTLLGLWGWLLVHPVGEDKVLLVTDSTPFLWMMLRLCL